MIIDMKDGFVVTLSDEQASRGFKLTVDGKVFQWEPASPGGLAPTSPAETPMHRYVLWFSQCPAAAQKINAIKTIRQYFGLDLPSAKDFIEGRGELFLQSRTPWADSELARELLQFGFGRSSAAVKEIPPDRISPASVFRDFQ